MKFLLAVDGSEPSLRATRKLIDMLGWYKELPEILVVNVHLPVPHVGGMHTVISDKDIDRYYADESAANLTQAVALLDAAGVRHTVRSLVGPLGETIVKEAGNAHCDLIVMGTRGRSAASALVFGSVTSEVLRSSTVPVMLVR
jgi:nucleotide-binding universal stress UspA family protein